MGIIPLPSEVHKSSLEENHISYLMMNTIMHSSTKPMSQRAADHMDKGKGKVALK